MRTVVKTYKFKLYQSKKNKHLDRGINIAASIWNYCIAMHRRYYRLYGKHLSAKKLKIHITKVKKTLHPEWQALGSQAIQECNDVLPQAGKAVGMDFGLKHFLNLDDGSAIDSPQWYKASLNELRAAHRAVSRCQKGSNNRKRAIRNLERVYQRISNRRRDWFFKLAKQLVSEYAIICIENLNLEGMKRLWGRKVSDLSFAEFVSILEWVASNAGSTVVKIDRWAPSSKACHVCGAINTSLALKQRSWECECCHTTLDRDTNAAINIRRMGLAQLKSA